jgi:UDP-N-acetylglucosamine acyltransferase
LRRELKLRRLAEEPSLPLASPPPSLVHPSATIDPSARLAPDVEVGEGVLIGPRVTLKRGAVIGAHSRLDEGCVVEAYGVVGERTWLKEGCEVSSFAVVGARPQLKVSAEDQHKQLKQIEPTPPRFELECGPRAQFREGSTVSRGAPWLGASAGVTRVGEGCLLMAYSHVGHDSQLSARCVLANQVSLAGHVEVGEGVTFGGHAAVHQFVTIGALAFIAANAMVSGDVPPYCLAAGDHATLRGLNSIGLRRAGVSAEARAQLKLAFHELLRGRAIGEGLSALNQAQHTEELSVFLQALKASSRGRCKAHQSLF